MYQNINYLRPVQQAPYWALSPHANYNNGATNAIQYPHKSLYVIPNRNYGLNYRNSAKQQNQTPITGYENYYINNSTNNMNNYQHYHLPRQNHQQQSNYYYGYNNNNSNNLNDYKNAFKSETSFDTGTSNEKTSTEDEFEKNHNKTESDEKEQDNKSNEINNELDDNSDDSAFFLKLFGKKNLSDDAIRKIERNQTCLSLLIEGDLIEYVRNETDLEGHENMRRWAVYMGNEMIMRFDNMSKTIMYESYWKIARNNFIFINRDLDKRLTTLPIYETLNKARLAFSRNKKLSKKFSSDKNFAMWCRFNINKSDIDFATDYKNNLVYSPKEAKEFLLNKFLNSFNSDDTNNKKI